MNQALRKEFASVLLTANRMVVDASPEMIARFPLGAPANDNEAWLKAVAELLGDAVELRRSRAGAQLMLVVKDRSLLFTYTQDLSLEELAEKRRTDA